MCFIERNEPKEGKRPTNKPCEAIVGSNGSLLTQIEQSLKHLVFMMLQNIRGSVPMPHVQNVLLHHLVLTENPLMCKLIRRLPHIQGLFLMKRHLPKQLPMLPLVMEEAVAQL